MTIIKTLALTLSAFLIALCLVSCKTQGADTSDLPSTANTPSVAYEPTAQDIEDLSRLANSYSFNLISEWNGNVFTRLDWDKFQSSSRYQSLYQLSLDDMGFTNPVQLTDSVSCFFPTDNYIFFSKISSFWIYRMNNDGSDVVQLSDKNCNAIVADGDTVYFATSDDGLYRMDQDGQNLKEVYSGKQISNIFPDGEYIYFCLGTQVANGGVASVINKYSLQDGSTQQIGTANDVDKFFVVGNKIYYHHNYNAGYSSLACMDITGENDHEIVTNAQVMVDTIGFYKNSLIFSASQNGVGMYTYALDLTTQKLTVISHSQYQFAYVIGDRLYTDQGILDLKTGKMLNQPLP